MFAPPPQMNVVCIKTNLYDQLVHFYFELGMGFTESKKSEVNRVSTYRSNHFEFKIVEVQEESQTTKNLNLRFLIDEAEDYVNDIQNNGGTIIKQLWDEKNYQHLEFVDPAGNQIELMSLKSSPNKK